MKANLKLVAALAAPALAIALGASALSVRAAQPADPVERLLNQSRAALGGDALRRVHVLESSAKVTFGGLPGSGTAWQEIGGNRFAESYSNPPIDGGDGYDGAVVWNRDGSGLVWSEGGVAGRSQEISQVFNGNYTLWSPHRGGASVGWGGTKTDGAHRYDVLRVQAPGSAVPFDLWIDHATHLPARYLLTIGSDSTITTFSRYRPVDGLMVPFAVHTESSDGNSADFAIVKAVANPPGGAEHLARPRSTVRDFSIAGSATETSVPIQLIDNHVYLSVMLNRKGPYRFIFDTGGANVIDPAVAREIGAAGRGSIQGGGAGSGTESIAFSNVETLQIGAATLTKQLFAVAPTRSGFGVASGQPVDGLIGFEVLARFVTTFDYAANQVVLKVGSAAPAAAGSLPFVLHDKQPQFPCTIDAIPSQCALDTGARNSLTLMSVFVASHPQIVPQRLSAPGVQGFGFGGPAIGRLGRLASLTIGGFTIENVIADFSSQTKGAFAEPFLAANVGGSVWKRFRLTLDYGREVMTLTPNAAFAEPDAYERAGLFLLNRGGKFVVLDARPGTPAADAGIAKGDTLIAIDGSPVTAMTLDAVRQTFLRPPGTVLKVRLATSGGTERDVTLQLRDYI